MTSPAPAATMIPVKGRRIRGSTMRLMKAAWRRIDDSLSPAATVQVFHESKPDLLNRCQALALSDWQIIELFVPAPDFELGRGAEAAIVLGA